MTAAFTRIPGSPPYWCRPATREEMAAHIRLRWLMERMQREARREDDHQHLPHW